MAIEPSRLDKARDHAAWLLINFILKTLATKWYQDRFELIVSLGVTQMFDQVKEYLADPTEVRP